MRHESCHIAALVADSGDVIQRPVGIGLLSRLALDTDIAPENLMVRIQAREGRFISKIAAFAVRDWDSQKLPRGNVIREEGVSCHRFQEDRLAAELERAIPNQRAREQPRFAEDL